MKPATIAYIALGIGIIALTVALVEITGLAGTKAYNKFTLQSAEDSGGGTGLSCPAGQVAVCTNTGVGGIGGPRGGICWCATPQ